MFIFYNFDFAGVVVWDDNPPFDRRCGTWSFSRNRLSEECWRRRQVAGRHQVYGSWDLKA